jgi:hypothetical protein
MKQKVVITKLQADINHWLENGWRVISVTPQHVGTNPCGSFCFVIEKEK